MNRVESIQDRGEAIQGEAMPIRYWELMSVEMNALYRFSFLLTADEEKAEQCLDQALDESADGVDDFLAWAQTRGRAAVLRHAIRTMKPGFETAQDRMNTPSKPQHAIGRDGVVASLPTFERFVFALTGIEGLSDEDCAGLLATTKREVVIARELMEHILAENDWGGLRQGTKLATRFPGVCLRSAQWLVN